MSKHIDISMEAKQVLTKEQAWYYMAVPTNVKENGVIHFFISDNQDEFSLKEEIEFVTKRKVTLEIMTDSFITSLLKEFYPYEQEDSRQQKEFYNGDADSFLNHLIKEAKVLNSSDIHVEIYDETCRVRIRIDGLLVQRYALEKKQYPALVNKIKIMSNLDIAEKRLPQDGRIFFDSANDRFDIRVSALPTLHGEKIVLRLLNNNAADINIETLGFSDFDLKNYMEGIRKPNGILLISGPTGSGKTTTLYATLKLLNRETRNILTIEDPIEYTLEGINQVQLKENIGLSFTAALRTFLRQDPDIIMLGEIRDADTANMAIRAALTGHLVLSTIHTNSAWGIISRLIDMGVAPYLIANTLNTAVAQRLIRVLCPYCKQESNFEIKLYPPDYVAPRIVQTHYEAKGCQKCYNTGYKGRTAVYEVIPIDMELSNYIKDTNLNPDDILKRKRISKLSENAFSLFEQGVTSIDEVYSLLTN